MPHDNTNQHDKHDKQGQSSYDPVPDTGKLYETRDITLSTILLWIGFVFVFVGVSAVVTWFIYKAFVPQGEESITTSLPHIRQLPPGPRLQADPVLDIKAYRQIEQQTLQSYGRDPRTGAIHIPIDRAIDLVLPDLPTRPGAVESDIKKTTAPNTPPAFDEQAPGSNSQNPADAGQSPVDSSQAPADANQTSGGNSRVPALNSPTQGNGGQ